MRTPSPRAVAAALRQCATILDTTTEHPRHRTAGSLANHLAPLLAARGWPAGTLGTGRGQAELTSVEAAVANPDRWADCDRRYDQLLRLAWSAALELGGLTADIGAHADPDGLARTANAGTGDCLACDTWVPGTHDDRLRAGFCDRCRQAWKRAGRPDRAAFVVKMRANKPVPTRKHGDRLLTSES